MTLRRLRIGRQSMGDGSRSFSVIFRAQRSYLNLTQSVDGVPHDSQAYESFSKHYFRFKIKDHEEPLGFVAKNIAHEFHWPEQWRVDNHKQTLSLAKGHNAEDRTKYFSSTVEALHRSGISPKLDAPKGEMLPVFGRGGQHLLDVDRAAAILFGTVSYGIQLLAYTRSEQGIRYWIPRRARTKRSYPGMLDNCVGGALNTGETPLTCLLREASEEASLPEEYVRKHAVPYDVLSYHMATDGNGEEGHQPQVMYVYHIELTPDVVPTPSDGEVEKFELMTLDEVLVALSNGQFKTNCAATWVSYLISIGVVNAENEPNLGAIRRHLHRRLMLPVKEDWSEYEWVKGLNG